MRLQLSCKDCSKLLNECLCLSLNQTNERINMPISIHKATRNKRELKSAYHKVRDYKSPGRVQMSYDDRCGNGHNTFYIGVESRAQNVNSWSARGDVIQETFSQYAHLTKWSGMSTDGPMHYIDNTLYWAMDNRIEARACVDRAVQGIAAYKDKYGHLNCEDNAATYCKDLSSLRAGLSIAQSRLESAEGPNLKLARSSAVAPNATLEQLQSEAWLNGRRPWLIKEFKAAMDSVFFTTEGSK